MKVSNAFMMQANLDQKHWQDSVLTNMKGDGGIDNDLAPESTLLGIDHNGQNRGNLNGEDEPALSLLEFDEGRGNGDAGPGHGARVLPDLGFDPSHAALEVVGLGGLGPRLRLRALGDADP
jgi:hypothetical protein